MFEANGYSSRFFDKLVQQFRSHDGSNQSFVDTDQTSHKYPLLIPYFGKDSRRLVNNFSEIIRIQLDVKIIPIYKSFKVKCYV